MPSDQSALTFDDLLDADLEQVYLRGKDEMLRGRAFRILLDYAATPEKLVKIVFEAEAGLAHWTTNELFEISNRFRLMSAPEQEIRLYRECDDDAFRAAPRVREFYVLALNRSGQPAAAIREASRILVEGGQNVLVWGALAQAHTACLLQAEAVLAKLRAQAHADIDPAVFAAHFPDLPLADLTEAKAEALCAQSMDASMRVFRDGFRYTGEPFPGLGWMQRNIDRLAAHARAGNEAGVAEVQHELDCLTRLVRLSLDAQGGRESRDYWTQAGLLQLAVVQQSDPSDYMATLAATMACADADFKPSSTAAELARIRDSYAAMVGMGAHDHTVYAAIVERATHAISVLLRRAPTPQPAAPESAAGRFLQSTFNFGALVGNMVPLTINGTIGRVGARVPDLLINRRVQQDLDDFIEHLVLPDLSEAERQSPRAVARRILRLVGTVLNIGELQDLKSPAHAAFDTRSDGLIALSGVDYDLRKDTRTGTDLTAAMLLQNCDCRETMYLNGALFARWQQRALRSGIARALQCMEAGHADDFERIVTGEIPALMRYQVRGGQVDVYVESIGMISKYQHQRVSEEDATARERSYGVAEWRAGEALTRYEIENAIIEAQYDDGTRRMMLPVDPESGARRPHPNTDGVPLLDAPERVTGLRLLNQVEAHALTFLYDTQQGSAELCDGFYNGQLFDTCPYAFASGALDLNDLMSPPALLRAGDRAAIASDGTVRRLPVFLRFLSYSRADYAIGLVDGDQPGVLKLMGRAFRANFWREQRRLLDGASPVPALLDKIHAWQIGRDAAQHDRRLTLDRRIARLMLDLAKAHPDQVLLCETAAGAPLIREQQPNTHVYLVLSGCLSIWLKDEPLRDAQGRPVQALAGNIVGQISALGGTVATATVSGEAVVLGIEGSQICDHFDKDNALPQLMDELSAYHFATLQANGYAHCV